MASSTKDPITIALVDDYDAVLMGVANMIDGYRDRVEADHEEIASWWPIRGPAGSSSTRGTFVPISWPVPGGTARTGICRRRCRPAPRWRR
jgi:hypothetical protein